MLHKNLCCLHIHAYLVDPFSLGAYSYMAFGASGGDFDDLAKPIPEHHWYFAGEATVREHFGTVHAAHLSGLREANRILEAIR